MAAEPARPWPLTNTPRRSRLGARVPSLSRRRTSAPTPSATLFDSPALDTLGIARPTGSVTAGDDDAEDRKNERKRAEYEILPSALRGEVRERANRHRDGEEPNPPPEQRRVATSAQDPRAAEHDQRGSAIEDNCGCACASLRR